MRTWIPKIALCICFSGIHLLTFGQNLNSSLDSLFQNEVITKSFEGTLLVSQNGEVIYQKSSGFRDFEQEIPIQIGDSFGIASITKMITSILILQLNQEGKIQFDQSLEELLPELKVPNAKRITIHHLLLHISGLPNERNDIYLKEVTPQEFVTMTLEKGTKSRGFGKFNYANIDYVLLGLIAEKIERKPWQEMISERILVPLEMGKTGFLKKESFPSNFVRTFSFSETDERISDPDFQIENFYAAGSMYSTVSDLLKLDQALYGEQLLSQESKKILYTSYPEYNYTGYGVWTYSYPFAKGNPLIMERRGGILGSNSVLVRMLDSNQTIIILSNNNRFNPDSFGDKTNLREAIITLLAEGEK
ncbi:CubicO group peptidase, beta-lactamase class C family [Algoriphagus ornithinivorans]|uniref:CubicO group peptidase, beta-lactamase class C family n=1 Tax=Algoriphagus ornithinivorans TaxID=226506 RepID=A0A1I5JSE8_9BACT|nr:serine hydrolase domain-containing protein [Algoriphagus ornithinivorans]SFO75256.1 CubicO group peptidase, beta-lactamase class C family [Algoriphagus ornithinivorans]